MKITVENLGPIETAEIELSPLTVFCGENNSGKTYTAYALFGFLNHWVDLYHYPKIGSLVDELFETGSFELPVNEILDEKEIIISRLSKDYSLNISNVFSADEHIFEGTNIHAQAGKQLVDPLDFSHAIVEFQKSGSLTVERDIENGIINFTLTNADKLGKTVRRLSHNVINKIIAQQLLSTYFPEPFIITAERMSLSLFYRELDSHKNTLVDNLMKLAKDDKRKFDPFKMIKDSYSRYSEPIHRNIDFIRELPSIKKAKSDLFKENPNLCKYVEGMMGIRYRVEDDGISIKSRKRKNNSFDLPIYLGSSAVRSLSELFFYLKHIARKGEIIIIDEPESHLSTENQINIAKLIAKLINSGMMILITTHSDYIIKELNNLIMLSSLSNNKEEILKKFKYDQTEILNANNCAFYHFKDSSATKCDITKFGVEIPLFDDAIEKLVLRSEEIECNLE